MPAKEGESAMEAESPKATREKLRTLLREGKLEDKEIEIEQFEQQRMPMVEIFTSQGVEEMDMNMKDMFFNLFPKKIKRRKFKVSEAREIIAQEEAQKLVDMDKVSRGAVERVEQSGIVFIDEIDKSREKLGTRAGRVEGRSSEDLLPIVEGSVVNTKYGMVKTDHILFIASGAFHISKPSDLIPEFQGRFPIRVELEPFGKGRLRQDIDRAAKRPHQAVHGSSQDRGDHP